MRSETIESKIEQAFRCRKACRLSYGKEGVRDETVFTEDGLALSVWGNIVASYNPETKVVKINHCGWKTQLTKDRINVVLSAFTNYSLIQRNYRFMLCSAFEFTVIRETGTKEAERIPNCNGLYATPLDSPLQINPDGTVEVCQKIIRRKEIA